MTTSRPDCPFCLGNGLLTDRPLFSNHSFYFLASADPDLPQAGMIIPKRHSETPFEMEAEEWAGFAEMLDRARGQLGPDGYTIGWNVGAVAGQKVFHTHLHVIARFKDEPAQGAGIRRLLIERNGRAT